MKSKIKRDGNQRQHCQQRGVHPLAVLDDDAFEQVGDVLAAVGRRLEEVEDLLPLDDRDRIALLVEELDDAVLVNAIGFVFELADQTERVRRCRPSFERADSFNHSFDAVADNVGEAERVIAHVRDFVQADDGGRRVDRIHHVVERAGERVNVFPVQRRDEGAVEPIDDATRAAVACVLDFLDWRRPVPYPAGCSPPSSSAAANPSVFQAPGQRILEEPPLSGKDIESDHVTSAKRRIVTDPLHGCYIPRAVPLRISGVVAAIAVRICASSRYWRAGMRPTTRSPTVAPPNGSGAISSVVPCNSAR